MLSFTALRTFAPAAFFRRTPSSDEEARQRRRRLKRRVRCFLAEPLKNLWLKLFFANKNFDNFSVFLETFVRRI